MHNCFSDMINIAMTNRATAYAAKIPSVRGFILHINIAVLSFVIGKQGDVNVPRLTNNVLPKRAPRRTFDLSKADDARKYVVRREVTGAKPSTNAPKL